MKKNELIQSIRIIIIGLFIVIGISFVYAENDPQWYGSASVPSISNTTWSPIDAGVTAQVKKGALTLGPATKPPTGWRSNLITNGFIKTKGILNQGGSNFMGDIFVGDILNSNSSSSFTVTSLQGTGDTKICATESGQLKVCSVGTCGTANGVAYYSTPTTLTDTQKCNTGTASAISGSGYPWTWTCSAVTGTVNCSANIIRGTAAGHSFPAGTVSNPTHVPGTYTYCNVGSPTPISYVNNNSGNAYKTWYCGSATTSVYSLDTYGNDYTLYAFP